MSTEHSASMTDRYVREVKLRREKVGSFDAYPFSLPVVRHLEALDLHPAVTFLVGENGSGKSTLLKALGLERVCVEDTGHDPRETGSRRLQGTTDALHNSTRHRIGEETLGTGEQVNKTLIVAPIDC